MSRLRGWLIRQRRVWKTRREGLSGAAWGDVEGAVRKGVQEAARPVVEGERTGSQNGDSRQRLRWLIGFWRH